MAQASRPAAWTSRSASLAFFLLLPVLSAADLTGTWIGLIPGQDRRPSQDLAFQFVHQGSELSGKQYGDDLSSAFAGGVVKDGAVRFEVVIREQQGNQVNDVVYEYEGKVVDDAIELTRVKASAKDAVSGAPHSRSPPQRHRRRGPGPPHPHLPPGASVLTRGARRPAGRVDLRVDVDSAPHTTQ